MFHLRTERYVRGHICDIMNGKQEHFLTRRRPVNLNRVRAAATRSKEKTRGSLGGRGADELGVQGGHRGNGRPIVALEDILHPAGLAASCAAGVGQENDTPLCGINQRSIKTL